MKKSRAVDVSVTRMITQVVVDQETHTLLLLGAALFLALDHAPRTWIDIEGAERMKNIATHADTGERKTTTGGEERARRIAV